MLAFNVIWNFEMTEKQWKQHHSEMFFQVVSILPKSQGSSPPVNPSWVAERGPTRKAKMKMPGMINTRQNSYACAANLVSQNLMFDYKAEASMKKLHDTCVNKNLCFLVNSNRIPRGKRNLSLRVSASCLKPESTDPSSSNQTRIKCVSV